MLSLSPHGGNRVLTEIANILVATDHEVTVIAGNLYSKPTYPFDGRVRVEIFPQGRGRIHSYLHLVRQIPNWAEQGWMPVLTHALTFSSFLLPKKVLDRSVIVIQDMDWSGVRQPFGMFMKAGGKITLRNHRAILAANPYLTNEIRLIGNNVIGQFKLGISKVFCDADEPITSQNRDIDFLFIARPQGRKRLSFYIEWIKAISKLNPRIRIAAASQDRDVLMALSRLNQVQLHQPSDDLELKKLYKRSKFFLLASSAEGFALPPLEAMGSGCIPVITECGGPSVYAKHNHNALVLPKTSSPQVVAVFCSTLLDSDAIHIDTLRSEGYKTSREWTIDNYYNANLIANTLEQLC